MMGYRPRCLIRYGKVFRLDFSLIYIDVQMQIFTCAINESYAGVNNQK